VGNVGKVVQAKEHTRIVRKCNTSTGRLIGILAHIWPKNTRQLAGILAYITPKDATRLVNQLALSR
jgi:hypothetical protein